MYKPTTELVNKALNMAAWACPDNESTGYSCSELSSMIRQLCAKVDELQKRLAKYERVDESPYDL